MSRDTLVAQAEGVRNTAGGHARDPPAEEGIVAEEPAANKPINSTQSDDGQPVATDRVDGLHKQQREALAEAPVTESPQVIGKPLGAVTDLREVQEKKRETDSRQTEELQQIMLDLADMVAHFRQELEAHSASIRVNLQHAARLKDETVKLCCMVQSAVDKSQQCVTRVEERLLQHIADCCDSSSSLRDLGAKGSMQEGAVSGALTVWSQNGKVTPRSSSSMFTGLLMGATLSRPDEKFRDCASSPHRCSGTKSPAAVAPQSEAAGDTDATPTSFIEACHMPTRSCSMSASGGAMHDSTSESKTKLPHHSRTPTLHREAPTESELEIAWQTAHSQHFGLTPDRGGKLSKFLPEDALTPVPAVSRPDSPPLPGQHLDGDPAHTDRDAADHLLRQRRLRQWRQWSRPREEPVACRRRARGTTDEKGSNEEPEMYL